MNKLNYLLLLLFFYLLHVLKIKEASLIQETRQDLEMISRRDGYDALENGDPYFAAKKF